MPPLAVVKIPVTYDDRSALSEIDAGSVIH
jgi:hypothetical protein